MGGVASEEHDGIKRKLTGIEKLKVAHFSTCRSGGAGTAAWRLHRGLRVSGACESAYACMGTTPESEGDYVIPKHYPRWYQRLMQRVGIDTAEAFRQTRRSSGLDLGNLSFSFPRSDLRLEETVAARQADLLNLHWVAGMLDWPTFFQRCDQPLVWTLHDMNPFLGGFHYTCDRDLAGMAARREEEEILQLKREALSGATKLTLVSPSRWLAEEAGRSELMSQFPCRVIPNGLDTTVFRPFHQAFARSVFALAEEARLLLTLSENLGSYRKGADLLAGALKETPLPKGWEVVAAGRGRLEVPGYPTRSLGSINDDRLLALLYSAVDLVVVPTRQDNLPNVVMEAIACGTPVVASNVGGIPDMIEHGKNGCLTESAGNSALAAALREAAAAEFDREAIRADAVARFDQSVTAKRYEILYREILGRA